MKIHKDHVIAQTNGGVRTVPACAKCNQSKGAKQLMQWLRDLKKNKPYRWTRITSYNKGKAGDIANKIQKIRDEK